MKPSSPIAAGSIDLCDFEFVGGGQCSKPAGHWSPRNDDPHKPVKVTSGDELYRDDVRDALRAAGWREDARGQFVAPNGAVWVETNDALDSGIDAPDKSWSVAFDSSVPAVVIVAAALASAGGSE